VTNLTANSPPVTGPAVGGAGYIQPSPGVVVPGHCNYRDGQVTAQGAATSAAPTAGTVVATVTPGTAGLWEVTGSLSVTGTTTVAAESNNMGLYQTATARLSLIPFGDVGTAGVNGAVPFGPVVLSLSAADTVNVKAIGNATGSSVYAASVICRLVG
jgi:hypothetical protein